MLGIIFTEFVEMVEEKFSYDVADRILKKSGIDAATGFTSVANYDHHDLIKLVVALHHETEIDIDDLVMGFGQHIFHRFKISYPHLFKSQKTSLDFLEKIEEYIHAEVKKLYPNAELPTFSISRFGLNELTMVYRSKRSFSNLAVGLIRGCGESFGENLTIERRDGVMCNEVIFVVTRAD